MVASVLSVGDPLGYTADEMVDALHLAIDSATLQQELEDMVASGVLDRRGIGRGALYTLARPVRLAKAAGGNVRADLGAKAPMVSKVG